MFYLKAILHLGLLIFFTILFKPFSFLNKKEIWFFIDRPFGIDNAYFLYKYVNEKNKNIKSIYLIENKQDLKYKEFKKENYVFNLSIKHFWCFIHAKKIIFSFDTKPFFFYKQTLFLKNILKPKAKFIFLQHGVIKSDLQPYAKKYTGYDLFISSSKREKEIISKTLKFDSEIKVTGLARFDDLYKNSISDKTILFMPSWKMDLYGKSNLEFKESNYYKKINELLTSKELKNNIEKKGYKLVFIPHYMMNEYINNFNNSLFEIKTNTNISKLLLESSIMITDYSSTLFDFGYMKKPCLYYQFHNYHYEDLLNYKNDLFGDTILKLGGLIKAINTIINNNGTIEEKYSKRIDNFFYKIDGSNCERNYKEILKIK